ncbi:hypothetical protein V2J09_009276 [Rumex salicifolius]
MYLKGYTATNITSQAPQTSYGFQPSGITKYYGPAEGIYPPFRYPKQGQFPKREFQTEYEREKFYVIKSYNEDDVHKTSKNITKRRSVLETTLKKGDDYLVDPILPDFFVFVILTGDMKPTRSALLLGICFPAAAFISEHSAPEQSVLSPSLDSSSSGFMDDLLPGFHHVEPVEFPPPPDLNPPSMPEDNVMDYSPSPVPPSFDLVPAVHVPNPVVRRSTRTRAPSVRLRDYACTGMGDSKPVATPFDARVKLGLDGTRDEVDVVSYRRLFMHAPTDEHWRAAKRVLRYVKNAPGQGLILAKNNNLKLKAFCDAVWQSCSVTRKSLTGFCIMLGASLISWRTKKQGYVATSSAESEL